ncbi:glutaredoxin family protein, partial [Klebsiella pneumoniae]|uniref:glutaredoxin family protein n=1 Tax=Klebsiella pneumoniae TaxID=573 RepID=UPI0034DD2879
MKEFLSREGVAFQAKNVDEDEQAYAELIEKGYRTIPVTFVGDQVIKGFDEAALRAAI